MKKPQIVLTLEALPDDDGVPVGIRLRQALKTLLRRDRFRCVQVSGDGLDEPKEQTQTPNPPETRDDGPA